MYETSRHICLGLFPNSDSSLKGSSRVFKDPSDVLPGSRRVAAEVLARPRSYVKRLRFEK